MKQTEIAWAAGIVDGEGCITITLTPAASTRAMVSPQLRLCLRVQMGHRETVERLARIFGVGTVHNNIKKSARVNPAYAWVLQARAAERVIKTIRPFLVTKAAEADVAIAFADLPLPPRGGRNGSKTIPPQLMRKKMSLYWKIRMLKPVWRFRNKRKHYWKNTKKP